MSAGGSLESIAERLSTGKAERDTIRFSECTVPGRKGYAWGAVMSTSPKLVRLFCDIWNARAEIAAAIRKAA
jgi:hypothetical protein